MIFDLALFLTSVFAGAVASVAGFGIGSLITPVLSVAIGTKIAIAVVSIAHLIATALRFFMLRSHLDKRVFMSFGLMSVAGGLLGALAHTHFAAPALTLAFGIILLFAGFMGLTGLSQKMRFKGAAAWGAGLLSGFLGGLVGNQGGIRSAALLGVRLSKESFVATATAIGLAVDAARMPVYFVNQYQEIIKNSAFITISSVGVVIGTVIGAKLLRHLPQRYFTRTVSGLIFLLGAWMIYKGF